MSYQRGKCDFPWAYNSRCAHSKTRFGGGAMGEYAVISDEEAMEFWAPWINSVFHPERAICFFWVVWPKIEFCLDFIRACGLKPSTLAFDWVKTTKDNLGFRVNPGAYTGSNSELCMLGVRGSMRPVKKLSGQVVESFYNWEEFSEPITIKHPLVCGADGKPIHSRKPETFKQKIDLMYPPHLFGNGIGLFEREPQGQGWHVFGNEVASDIPGPKYEVENGLIQVIEPAMYQMKLEIVS